MQNAVPAMTIKEGKGKIEHRTKLVESALSVYACIARPVSKREIESNDDCKKAMDKEWDRLTAKKVWDLNSVREWDDVAAEANEKNEIVHMGRVFGIMVEKNSEVPDLRKYKYRVVSRGTEL